MDNKEKSCCFFGHRYVTHDIKAKLTEIIQSLITEEQVYNFYVGHQGQFDSMVYSVLKELKIKYPQINYSVVLAYMPDKHIKEMYGEDTIFPDGLESVPKRFAILKRNDWIIRQSDFLVCYVYKVTGGAVKCREKAANKGLKIIDLYASDLM